MANSAQELAEKQLTPLLDEHLSLKRIRRRSTKLAAIKKRRRK
ncbi:MAG: hypothetical protein NWF03_00540 [Candidatus Bathyarchaeota archaeon]|nr:hypothetical protein [Candidatus Bathyarchaeota archaeon]